MTAYTAIPSGDVDPESPITTGLVTALRDNPLAIAEGDASAPDVALAALEDSAQALVLASSGLHVSVPFGDAVGVGGVVPAGDRALYLFHSGYDTRDSWTDLHLVENIANGTNWPIKKPITFHNPGASALLVNVKLVIWNEAGDVPIQVRLLRDGVVQETVDLGSGSPGTLQTVTFAGLPVGAGVSAYFDLQGIVAAGGSVDVLELQELYAWLTTP